MPRDAGHVYAVSPDGKRVVTSDGYLGKRRDRKHPPLRLWDLKSGEKVAEFSLPEGEFTDLRAVAFVNGGKSLAVLGAEAGLHVWPIEGGVRAGKVMELTDGPGTARFTPDASRLVGDGRSQHVSAWDVKSGNLRWQQELAPRVVPILSWSR